MQGVPVCNLPEACSEMNAFVSADVHVLHFLTLAITKIINDVEILEVAADVVCEIDAMSWVAACCAPMSGVTLQRPHSCQTQAVQIPIQTVFVYWGVVPKRSLLESG